MYVYLISEMYTTCNLHMRSILMNREQIRNMVTYASLQSIVEEAVTSVEGFAQVDMSKLTPYILSSIVRRAKQLPVTRTTK